MSTKVITGIVRFSYANVWDPKPSLNGGKDKYSVSLIIKKSDKKTIDDINKAIEAAYNEGQSKLKGTGKTVPPLSQIHKTGRKPRRRLSPWLDHRSDRDPHTPIWAASATASS